MLEIFECLHLGWVLDATLTLSRDDKKNFRRPGAFAESGAHPNLELVPPQSTIVQWLLG